MLHFSKISNVLQRLFCKRRRVIKVKRNTIFSLFPTRFLLVCWYFLDVFLCVYIYSWDRVNSHEYGYFGFINFTRLRGNLCDFNSVEHDIADDLFLVSTTVLIVPVTFGGPLWFPVNCLWSLLVYYYQPFLLMLGNQDHFLTFMWWFPFFPGIAQLVTSHHKKIGKQWKPCISKRLTESGNRTLRV